MGAAPMSRPRCSPGTSSGLPNATATLKAFAAKALTRGARMPRRTTLLRHESLTHREKPGPPPLEKSVAALPAKRRVIEKCVMRNGARDLPDRRRREDEEGRPLVRTGPRDCRFATPTIPRIERSMAHGQS